MATRRTPRASSPSKRPPTKSRRARPTHASAAAVVKGGGVNGDEYGPRLLRFLVKPAYSLTIIVITVLLYLVYPTLAASSPAVVASRLPEANPFAPFLLLSYPVAPSFSNSTTYVLEDVNATIPRAGVSGHHHHHQGVGGGQFGKGLQDLLFLAFYVVVHSFVRHAFMKGPLVWVANWAGVRKGGKTGRFVEQAYMVVYFAASGAFGLHVMSQQKSWWYQTEHFWTDFPSTTLPANLKAYYLLQFAYWLQETFVILAGMEKPRADNAQMTFHHIITIWLIAESYLGNLEQIGLAIFVSSMDLPDFMLSFSKCINYAELENTGNCSFLIFIASWTYLRHYQNIRMLYNVWHQKWMPTWFRMMIFVPILLLQITIFFWSYRIGRIVYKLVKGTSATDEREKGETDTESEGEDDNEPATPPAISESRLSDRKEQ